MASLHWTIHVGVSCVVITSYNVPLHVCYGVVCLIGWRLSSVLTHSIPGVHNFTTLQGTEAISNICTLHGSPGEQRPLTWFPRGTEAPNMVPQGNRGCFICTLHGSPGEQRLFHLHPNMVPQGNRGCFICTLTWFPRGTEAVSSAP